MVVYFYKNKTEIRLEYEKSKKHDEYIEFAVPDKKNTEQYVIHQIPVKDIKEIRTDLMDKQMRRKEKNKNAPRNYLTGF